MTYPGVTHEFFGMGAVVPEAKNRLTDELSTRGWRIAG